MNGHCVRWYTSATDMKNILTYWIQACISLDLYKKISQFSLKRISIYYLIFLVLLNGLYTGFVIYKELPRKKAQLTALISDAVQFFPPDVTVQWTGNELTTSAPVIVQEYPELVTEFIPKESLPSTFFALSASTSAFIKVSNTELTFTAQDQPLASVPLTDFLTSEQVTITAQNAQTKLWQLFAITQEMIIGTIFAGGIAFVALVSVTRILSLIFELFFIFILQKILGGALSLATMAKYVVTVSIPAELISALVAAGVPQSTLPIYSLTLWIYLGIVLVTVTSRRSE